MDVPTVVIAPLTARPNALRMPRELGAKLRAARKLVPDMPPRGDGTHRRARHGTHPANQLGSPAPCFRERSNRCSRAFQHRRFDHELVSRVGTRARSGKATARIRGTGWRWRSLSAFPRMPDSQSVAASPGELHRCERWRLPKTFTGVHLAADYGPKRSNSDRFAGGASQLSRRGKQLPEILNEFYKKGCQEKISPFDRRARGFLSRDPAHFTVRVPLDLRERFCF